MTTTAPPSPARDGSRDTPARTCPICGTSLASPRARYCSHACRQRAYRLARPSLAVDTAALTATLRRRHALAAHTVYECPACEARFLGERRCPDCNRFCRALGLGRMCPECDAIILLADLLGAEVTG